MISEYLLSSKHEELSTTADLRFFGTTTVNVQKAANDTENQFNRYCLTYTAGMPVRAKIYYTAPDGNENCEEFYLEPALKETVFRSFTDEYLAGKLAKDVSRIEFFNTKATPCRVVISSFTTEIADVLSEDTVYIENDYLKVGARLSYGGGLSYIKFKGENPEGIENLLNHCDTGRLVQQAYFGTTEEPYYCATYEGSKRSYNPIQGGDQYNNPSKIIDFRIENKSLYVKCRPLDWAHNKRHTMSYMENTYSLGGKLLRVDNRFIDFSPYEHTLLAHQELPAFYTISGLKKFVYYNGDASWTGDTLTHMRDLPFWGGNQDAYFYIKPNNKETWCAFTDDNEENGDFGVGLFVPEASILLAGRFQYDGSLDPMSRSTNYVAPLRSMKLKSFKPIEYSYLITAGKLEDIRRTFTENATLIDNSKLLDY